MAAVTPDKDAPLDRVGFQLDAEQFAAFVTELDAPPVPNARLRKLLTTPAPWNERPPTQGRCRSQKPPSG